MTQTNYSGTHMGGACVDVPQSRGAVTRFRLWLAWKMLPRSYVIGRYSYGGVIKELE